MQGVGGFAEGEGGALQEGVAGRDVGDDDDGAGFADVPRGPARGGRFGEGIVFVEDGGEDLRGEIWGGWGVGVAYDEYAEAEEDAEGEFS